jgi:uncharacterized RDD family membrane protein YckC
MSQTEPRIELEDIEQAEDFFGYAGFWKRLFAFVIDWLIIGLLLAALGVLVSGSLEFTNMLNKSEGLLELAGIILPWLYYAGMESSEHQATLGKLALNIKVTDMAGRRIGFLRATVRYFSKILSSMLFLIGYIMIAFTARKQGLHDLIAACLVVNRV